MSLIGLKRSACCREIFCKHRAQLVISITKEHSLCLTFRSEVVLDALLAGPHHVHSRHPELVLDALLQSADLLVVDVWVGDQNVRQLVLVDPSIANPVRLQLPKRLGGSLPLQVHGDLVVSVHQPGKVFFILIHLFCHSIVTALAQPHCKMGFNTLSIC